jgi:hypothetical protein
MAASPICDEKHVNMVRLWSGGYHVKGRVPAAPRPAALPVRTRHRAWSMTADLSRFPSILNDSADQAQIGEISRRVAST